MITAPSLDSGALATLPIIDSQGLGVPAHANDPEGGAALLETLLGQAAADTLYERLGLLPARADWTAPPGEGDPGALSLHERHRAGQSAPYIPNMLPLSLHFEVCAALGQAVIAGTLDPAQAGREADAICANWRASHAERVGRYREWIDGIRLGEQAP